jgi:hypothetical protein
MKMIGATFWIYVSSVPVGIVLSWFGFCACGAAGAMGGYVIGSCGMFWLVEHLLFMRERRRSRWYKRAYDTAKGWEQDETYA